MRVGLILIVLLSMSYAHATVYKWIDENGKVHFSDEPVKNAEVVEFKKNTQNNIKLPEIIEPPIEDTPDANDINNTKYELNIVSPSEEETIRSNEGNITIIADISPQLFSPHKLVLYMDGEKQGASQSSNLFKLKGIDRGEHTFTVKAVTKNGKQLASSKPRKVFLHRTSLNQPKILRPQPRNNN